MALQINPVQPVFVLPVGPTVAQNSSGSSGTAFNVLNFGADATGSTDSSPAFNKCVSALNAIGGGQMVVPAGYFLLNSTVIITGSPITVLCAGVAVTTFIAGAANGAAIQFGNGTSIYFNGGISNASFTSAPGVSGTIGLFLNMCGQCMVNKIRADNSRGALFQGIIFSTVSQTFFSELQVQGCTNIGTTFKNCTDLYGVSSRSDANGVDGFWLNGSQGCYFFGLTAFGNTNNAWFLVSDNPAAQPNFNNFFVNCIGDTSGSYNWGISDSENSNWISCWGSTQLDPSVNTFACGFYMKTDAVKNLTFVACIAVFNNAHGFFVDSAISAPSNITFTDCTFGLSGVFGSNGNGRSGVGYGLEIGGGAINGIRINGGKFESNVSGPILNSSTGDVQVFGCPIGYVNEAHGTQAVGNGLTSIAVTFTTALAAVPSKLVVTPQFNAGAFYLTSISDAGFTINWATATAGTQDISWDAKI